MAREIKTLTVKPDEDAQTIQNLQCFGWTLLTSQEVYNKDSHLEAWGKNTYSVTQTTHYVKLTFERDPAKMVNYSQIRRMEEAYMAVPGPKRKPIFGMTKKEAKLFTIIFTSIVCVFVLPLSLLTGQMGMGLFMCAIFFGMTYLMTRWGLKVNEKHEIAVARCWKKRNQIAQQAEKYL